MPLDSDAQHAAAQLHVTFYEKERGPDAGQIYCRIMVPGDQLNIWDQPAREADKNRFQHHWLAFQRAQNGDVAAFGTSLNEWYTMAPADLSEGQLSELTTLRFQTVEQLAGASDAQIQRIGMGGAGLRERARGYLAGKNRSDTSAALDAANARADRLEAQMEALMERLESGPEPERNKGGRPRKVTEDVLVHADAGNAGHG